MTPAKITVQNTPITVTAKNNDDYICITDMAKAKTTKAEQQTS